MTPNLKLIVTQEGLGASWTRPTEIRDGRMFPAGEVNVSIPRDDGAQPGVWHKGETYRIVAALPDAAAAWSLIMAVNAIRENAVVANPQITLDIGYMPYARQDRVCNPGEANSAKAFAHVINSLNVERVVLTDPHSDVMGSVVNNARIFSLNDLFRKYMLDYSSDERIIPANTVLVAPDAGARKKVESLAKEFGFKGIVYANKVRNTRDGKILRTTVDSYVCGDEVMDLEDLKDQHLLVVDDICDGGRTFTELAKVLKPYDLGILSLYVTHGIFSAGVNVLTDVFDKVYTMNTYHVDLPERENNPVNLIAFKHL
ncbi:ribose-phosphate pyrophosphokinase [Pseudomonas phage D6]|nr:ribose-phosphate pyrophosphokinase [Pseudomonas phage D6]